MEPIGDERADFRTWALFLRVHAQLVKRMDTALRATAGIPITWYDALFQIDLAPGHRMRLQDLESAVFLSQSGVSRLAGRLEQEGLLVRSVAGADRRGVEVSLTPAGVRALRRARAVQMRLIREAFADRLSDAQIRALRDALQSLDGS
mgnify:CR=1 FL=1